MVMNGMMNDHDYMFCAFISIFGVQVPLDDRDRNQR